MGFRNAIIVLTCWLFATAAFRAAGQSLKSESIQKIDKLFAQWNLRTSPGCAVAVVLEGQTVYEKCFGQANLEDQIPITSETVFDACSVAKEFTALAVQLLVTAGKCLLGGSALILLSGFLGLGLFVPLTVFPHLIVIGVFSIGLSILFFMLGLREIGSLRTGVIFSTSSLFGATFAFVVLGEKFTIIQVFAGLLMVLGVYVLYRK